MWHRDLWYVLEEVLESMRVQIGPLQTTIVDVHYEAPFDLPLYEEKYSRFGSMAIRI